MPQPPVISFVIPVKNDADRLARCLDSIGACVLDQGAIEIWVIDNGSADESALRAQERGANVLVAPELSVAGLRNLGAERSSAPLLAFVDADHELVDSWVAAARAVFAEEGRDVGAAGAPYLSPPHGTWVQRTFDLLRVHVGERRPSAWLGAGNLVVRRDVFDRLGGFDVSLVTCEDVDLCARVREVGLRVISDPALQSIHHGDPETLLDLFRGELWRGRDNVRASLRIGLTWRNVPSVAAPLLGAALVVGLVGALFVAVANGSGTAWLAAVVGVGAVFPVPRLLLLLTRRKTKDGVGLGHVWLVAVVYEWARVFAILLPARHHRDRGAS